MHAADQPPTAPAESPVLPAQQNILASLHRIVQETNAAADVDEAVQIIVRRVKAAIAVDVCSVYLADPGTDSYVLMATDGLNPESVHKVRMLPSEGLAGLVVQRREPVNLEDASLHPRYRYFPETGEERFHAYLGVPIVHFRRPIGVLVAQQRERRRFAESETAFLVTMAAQLAGAIQHARTSGGLGRVLRGSGQGVSYIQGLPGAPGTGIGTIVLADPFADLSSVPERPSEDPAAEERAFRAAVDRVGEEIAATRSRLPAQLPGDVRAIFDVYALLLESEQLVGASIARIRAGQWAAGALRDTVEECVRAFERADDPYLRARAEDLRGIGRRILLHLQPARAAPDYPEATVLVGEEIGVVRMMDVPADRLAGIVATHGSGTSHITILARSLGIPAVMGVGDFGIGRLEGRTIVVDGHQGRVYVQPPERVLREFERLKAEERTLSADLAALHDLPAATPDGTTVALHANAGLMSDIPVALAHGAEGVGLYRTEFAFMVREAFPGEEDQYRVYRQVLESFAPRPVTMRTLDVGGDKKLPYMTVREDNPFMGWRGIRVTYDHPEIFVTQLRALLGANVGLGNLRLLLPLVTTMAEIEDALALIECVEADLAGSDAGGAHVPVGVMVETPAAALQIGAIAHRVDFVSVGTNDLIQFLFAADRNNARVAHLCDPVHPAVLQLLQQIMVAARAAGTPVSICGEMPADPVAATLLLGLGVDTLSVAASVLPKVKWLVRKLRRADAAELFERALALDDAAAVRGLVAPVLREQGLGALLAPAEKSTSFS